jgi:hypothetical protein
MFKFTIVKSFSSSASWFPVNFELASGINQRTKSKKAATPAIIFVQCKMAPRYKNFLL